MKIGVTFGCWDLLHVGHVIFLRKAKSMCEHLTVGLHVDPSLERPNKNKPVQTLVERFYQLEGLDLVDFIIPYQTENDIIDILKLEEYDVRFVGSDYILRKEDITGLDLTTEIEFIDRDHRFSTSDLRMRVFNAQKPSDFSRS